LVLPDDGPGGTGEDEPEPEDEQPETPSFGAGF